MNPIRCIAVLLFLAAGCRATYELEETSQIDGTYSYARPSSFSVVGTESVMDWVELVSATQSKDDKGAFVVDIALRNHGGTGFFSWFQRSHDMTVYARVDFYAGKGGPLLHAMPRQAVPLPLGDTVHMRFVSPVDGATYAKLILLEK